MKTLNLPELLKVTSTTDQGLKSIRRRGQFAGGFGLSVVFNSLRYLGIDAMGMLISRALAPAYGQTMASQLVRTHFDVWGRVVAEAEADPMTDQSFCIVDFIRETDGKKAHLACGARDTTPEQIAATLQRTPAAKGFVAIAVNCVNVSYLMRWLRKNAAAEGIDLLDPFLPPPDHPKFAEIFAPYVEARDNAIVTVKERRSREAFARRAGERARKLAEGTA